MARLTDNNMIESASGKIGAIVFFQRNGKTFMRKAPKKPVGPIKPGQERTQRNFARANIYAKWVNQDPEMKIIYQTMAKPYQPPYNAAVTDFLTAPVINEIDLSGYSGTSGDTILIRTPDLFKITTMIVKIHQADGSLLETGNAVQVKDDFEWKYTTVQNNALTSGSVVTVIAGDRPGKNTEVKKSL